METILDKLFSKVLDRYGEITVDNLFNYILVNYNQYFFLCGRSPEIITVRKGECTAEICRELYETLINDGVEITCRNGELVIHPKGKKLE